MTSLESTVRQQLTRDIAARLLVETRYARWFGEYGNLTPELLERVGVDIIRTLTNPDYTTEAVGIVHKKVGEGEAVLEDIAKLLLYKSNCLMEHDQQGRLKVTYTLPAQRQGYTQQEVKYEGVLDRTGAWPTIYTQEYVKEPQTLRSMKLTELVQLRDKLAELPDQDKNQRISDDLLSKQVKEQIEITGKRELSDKLNLDKAFDVFQRYGLRLHRGQEPISKEGLLAYLSQSITSASTANLQERSVQIPFDWGHGVKVSYTFTTTPSHNLTQEQRLFLAHGDIGKLGVTLDRREFRLEPDNSSDYANSVARLLRDSHITTYNSGFTNETVRFLKSRILGQGTLIGAEAYKRHEVDFRAKLSKIDGITIDDQRTYPALLIEAIENLSTVIRQLPPNQQQIYRADTNFVLRTGSSNQPEKLDFLTLLDEFSKSLKVLKQENNIFGVLDSAMPMYAYEHNARGVTLHPELKHGKIGIYLNYTTPRSA